ncbi:hypothetical protein F5Y17DRAFT_443881 [Xylariaceae sp. FL0594]|nr:hypothetical protein F5Y17DRAFT_443881 [Xylariaceae sp. FL0594]
MASSTVADSTLARPRAAVAVASALAGIILSYYAYREYRRSIGQQVDDGPSESCALQRRNAVRRPHRAPQSPDEPSGSEFPSDESETEIERIQRIAESIFGTRPPGNENDENVDQVNNATQSDGSETAEGRTNGVVEQPGDGPASLPAQEAQLPTQEWYDSIPGFQRQRTGENIVTLLFRVSEDNARRNAYVHRGCLCNGCGMLPIRGIRYRCANCADFDLCEACEAQGMHNKTHVFYKVRIPVPSSVAKHVQPPWYPGDPDAYIRNLPRTLLAKWSHETGFERVELEALWEQWTFTANTEWREDPNGLGLAMDRKTFERCLVPSAGYHHPAPNLIHDRMFAFYDTNHDDLIGFEEFLLGVSYKKRKDKINRIFEGYDVDGDGYVSRRDFLRMFRAYYVCYKQMHHDTVLGLDDYMMTSVEAQQLVNSRQPLSSLFGREGRVAEDDQGRVMEGKVWRSGQDVEVVDGKGAVSEDKPDTSSREDILRELFTRGNNNQSIFTESFGPILNRSHPSAGDLQYASAILNPPENLADLGSVLSGQQPDVEDVLNTMPYRGPELEVDYDTATSSSNGDDESTNDGQVYFGVEPSHDESHNALTQAEITDVNQFLSTITPAVPSQFRPEPMVRPQRANLERRKRVLARRMLYERWKRRQFYLDEEEGAAPPEGWRDEQDVLANLDDDSQSSKSGVPLLSTRSRSSSKVQFAETTDDFETRSNHSTSSRSVPERWGGMDIPDAERDAGKEILYQVAQQAFNELLDVLFKRREDLAIRVAESKEQREKYRQLLDSLEINHFKQAEIGPALDELDMDCIPNPGKSQRPPTPRPIHEQSLEELLASSGYTINVPPDAPSDAHQGQQPEASKDKSYETWKLLQEDMAPLEEGHGGTEDPTTSTYRDPTMPQFRPNTITDKPDDTEEHDVSKEEGGSAPKAAASGRPMGNQGVWSDAESRTVRPDTPSPISRHKLLRWKLLDLVEQQAKERGGWGRLNFVEFDHVYREHEFQDGSKNRLAYLGSWIDFCLPS